MDFNEEFGARLRAIRKQRGYTVTKVITDLNLKRGTYNNWECGHRMPTATFTTQLSEYFGVSINFLLGEEEADKKKININDWLVGLENDTLQVFVGDHALTPEDIKEFNDFLLNKYKYGYGVNRRGN